jgi:hypothetical protein
VVNEYFFIGKSFFENRGLQFVRWVIGFGYGVRCSVGALLLVVLTA